MAEFALGLTKSAVEGALTRVKSAIEEEDKQRVRVQDDLVFITGEFQMMQSFLGVANSERANNPVVRTWVKQLRDLAFDVEDCVEFVIHLDKPSRLDWVRRFTSSVICIARPPLPLDVAVADIKRLKTRVEDVSQRNTRYNLISDSGSSSNSAVTVVSTAAVELKPSSTASTLQSALCKVWEEAGRKRQGMGDLKKLIMREGRDLEVISLWGSQEVANLGATHVIREAYNDPEIRQEFSIRARVKLLHPFNLDEFLKSFLTQFNTTASSHRQRSSRRSHLRQHMAEQRYLVILEDVRAAAELDDIREYLPDSKNGSRIVVSMQQLGLAISCLSKSYQVAELKKFPHGQSLYAFINKVPDCRSCMSWQLRCGGVISVWGDSESTTILDSVYTSITHKSKAFENEGVEFEKHSWVEVPSPFEIDVFSRRLLLSFHGDDFVADEVEAVGRMGHQGVVERCQRFLQEYKCLVVINGLKNKDDWDSIKSTFLSMSTNGCILAITHPSVRDAGVLARYCVDKEDRAINIQYLESDYMLCHLIKVAFGGKQLSPEEIQVSKLTVAKCGGLPKVITAIGEQYIASKGVIDFLESLNNDFMGTLETKPEFCSLKGLFGWMQSYFDACSDALKPCIFYLSVFPIVNDIRRGRLLRRWIAEGYSRDKFGITAEKDGENLFYELVKLSIIQEPPGQTHDDRSKSNDPDSKVDNVFQVNGFFHEYIISRQLEDNLVFALEGHCDLNSQRVGQHLTIRSSWDRDEIVFESIDLSRLRSLTVFGEWRPFFISTAAASSNMRLLRVLDLEDTSGVTNDDFEQIGKLLPRLKYLSVRGCKEITRMPDSLGGLRQLQTLDVSYTNITKLPCVIINLVKLEYLCAGTTLEPLDQDDDAQPAAADHTDMSRGETSAADHDDTSRSQTAVADHDDMSRSQTAVADHDDDVTSTIEPAATAPAPAEGENSSSTLMQWRRKTHNLVQSYSCSWSSKKKKKQFDNGGGVKVHAAGFGKLTALHSLGIVNVSGAGGNAILKEMKKLTQLHNLWVSGINQKNWHNLCSVISGHGHLESLSVRLDYEQEGGLCSLNDIPELPDTLKSFRVFGGNARASPTWILSNRYFQDGHAGLLACIELTISTQEDMDSLKSLPYAFVFPNICVKPIQDGELRYGCEWDGYRYVSFTSATVFKIECNSYKLALVFGHHSTSHVEVLEVNCSSATESSLKISGLENLACLKEVCLKGSYSDELRQYLQQKVDCLECPYKSGTWPEHHKKPVLKLDPQHSAPSTPCASLKRLFT